MNPPMLKIALIVSTLVFAGGVATAGPDETTNRLISEKVSMLDLGMFRLELDLDKLYDKELKNYIPSFLFPTFNWDDNTIVLNANIPFSTFSQEQAKEKCSELVGAIRSNAGVFNGELLSGYSDQGYSQYASYFRHIGYAVTGNGKQIEDLLPDLDAKFRIVVRIDFVEDERHKVWVCKGRLISDSVAFEEIDRE